MGEECPAVELAGPEARREAFLLALRKGYTVKELAELVGVSPPAVSRYSRGSLAPSAETTCKLLSVLDEETRLQAEALLTRRAWERLRSTLERLAEEEPATAIELLEAVADDTAALLEKAHKRLVRHG